MFHFFIAALALYRASMYWLTNEEMEEMAWRKNVASGGDE